MTRPMFVILSVAASPAFADSERRPLDEVSIRDLAAESQDTAEGIGEKHMALVSL